MKSDTRVPLQALQTFFATFRFPVFALAMLGGYVVCLLAVLLLPRGQTGLAAFAEEFRTWCFGFDPATGQLEWGYVVTTFGAPLLLGTILVGVWGEPLRHVLRNRRRAILPWAAAGLGLAGLSATAMTTLGGELETGELPFPAESLRTELAAPPLVLINHEGRTLDLRELRGRVVVITAVYSQCGNTCPMLMAQTRAALGQLTDAEKADLTVLAISLDSQHDSPEILAQLAAGRGFAAPGVQFLTGDVDRVEGVLDALGFARTRDTETGVIDHANLFIVVDRAGRIAYRFSLGERQQSWLVAALRLLLDEPATS